jgi:hypothetical protein
LTKITRERISATTDITQPTSQPAGEAGRQAGRHCAGDRDRIGSVNEVIEEQNEDKRRGGEQTEELRILERPKKDLDEQINRLYGSRDQNYPFTVPMGLAFSSSTLSRTEPISFVSSKEKSSVVFLSS